LISAVALQIFTAQQPAIGPHVSVNLAGNLSPVENFGTVAGDVAGAVVGDADQGALSAISRASGRTSGR
jgi:hypothetical protein